jgi:hypothetical protein
MRFANKICLGVSGYWQGIISVDSLAPSPWGEGQGEGTRVREAGHLVQIERLARFADKREGGISLPLLFSTVISGV